ncbi:hypothetical protein [Alteromonas sp. CYL-A6]|uniref:hypothetical protein n=1 Tax=Alteromonas nitratireducens TaxID=3390813 RepID=UPI0034B59CC0
MNVLFFLLIISVLSGLVLVVLGYLIAVKKQHSLINGVDFSSLSNPDGFGGVVGNSILISGALMMLMGVVVYLQVVGLVTYLLLMMMVSFMPLPAFFYAKAKFAEPGRIEN